MHSKNNKSIAANAANSAAVSNVATLALQLNSGERLIHDFKLDVSLKDILKHWDSVGKLDPPLSPSNVPVCIYLRKEVAGDVLANTTLHQLGITGGKIAIRYLIRSSDAPREQAHVGGILAPPPRPLTPEDTKPVKQNVEETSTKPEKVIKIEEEIIPIPETCKEEESTTVEMQEVFPEMQKQSEKIEANKTQPIAMELAEIPENLAPVNLLNDRGDLIYSMDEKYATGHSTEEVLPEDFFELSVDEVRKRMKELRQQVSAMNEAPLVTAEHRQAQKEQRTRDLLGRYPVTVLRVQFSDRLVLQLPLPSQTLILQVVEEVAMYLDGSPSCDDSYLFTSPPKVILERKSSLLELGLTPSAVVYVGSHKMADTPYTIKAHHRQNLSSFLGAMRDVAQRIASPYHQQNASAQLESSDDRSTQTPPAKRSTTSTKPTNVPKWFKMKH